MTLDKHLFRNYNELCELIFCCYKDISILNAYEKLQNEKKDLYNIAPHISNHFVILAQKDLALTLWKISCDTHPSANTVSKFRNTIGQLLKASGSNKQIKKEKTNESIKNTLNTLKEMRRTFLAHTDMNRDNSKIKICELKELLDVKCREFNNVCDMIDDDRVTNIEIDISFQDMDYYPELLALYSQK